MGLVSDALFDGGQQPALARRISRAGRRMKYLHPSRSWDDSAVFHRTALHIFLARSISLLAASKSSQASAPPSAVRMAPVIALAAGLARKTTALAISRGSA